MEEEEKISTPPRRNKTLGLVSIILILLIIVLVVLGYFYFNLCQENKALKLQVLNLTQEVYDLREQLKEVTDWKTYRSEDYGFEVKYPPDFIDQKDVTSETLLAKMKTDRGSSYYFTIRVMKNYKIDQIISNVEEIKKINIGGHLGYEYFYIEGAGMSEVALIQVGEDALSISFDCIGNGQNFATANDRKIYVQDFFNQIFSTFKFLE